MPSTPNSRQRLPNFLIIGAMKAGTTTLFHDLRSHPMVYFPQDKEPNALCDDRVLTPDGLAAYQDHFSKTRGASLRGEASTEYSKLPDIPGVPERARHLLGPACKIIYVVRDPVDRIASQYKHEYGEGLVEVPFDEAVRSHHRYISYSAYATQLDPWVAHFGREQIYIVHFESYVKARAETVRAILEFLGAPTESWDLPNPDAVYNRSQGRPIVSPGWERVQDHWLYRRFLRRFVSIELRSKLRSALLPSAPAPPPGLPESASHLIWDELADEMSRFYRDFGFDHALWKPPH